MNPDSNMHCEQAEILIAQLIFDEIESAVEREILFQHLKGCKSCTKRHADMKITVGLVGEGLQNEAEPKFSPDRKRNLLKRLNIQSTENKQGYAGAEAKAGLVMPFPVWKKFVALVAVVTIVFGWIFLALPEMNLYQKGELQQQVTYSEQDENETLNLFHQPEKDLGKEVDIADELESKRKPQMVWAMKSEQQQSLEKLDQPMTANEILADVKFKESDDVEVMEEFPESYSPVVGMAAPPVAKTPMKKGYRYRSEDPSVAKLSTDKDMAFSDGAWAQKKKSGVKRKQREMRLSQRPSGKTLARVAEEKKNVSSTAVGSMVKEKKDYKRRQFNSPLELSEKSPVLASEGAVDSFVMNSKTTSYHMLRSRIDDLRGFPEARIHPEEFVQAMTQRSTPRESALISVKTDSMASPFGNNHSFIRVVLQGKGGRETESQPIVRDLKINWVFDASKVKRSRLLGYEAKFLDEGDQHRRGVSVEDIHEDQMLVAIFEIDIVPGKSSEVLGNMTLSFRGVESDQIKSSVHPLILSESGHVSRVAPDLLGSVVAEKFAMHLKRNDLTEVELEMLIEAAQTMKATKGQAKELLKLLLGYKKIFYNNKTE